MLRRVLWLIPTLFFVSVVTFQFLAWTLPVASTPDGDGWPRSGALPVFANTHPENARDLALTLMDRVASGGPEAPEAERQLVQLGGAGLPHVLPRLDQLRPKERARVALALTPLARRMGIANREELKDADSASLFWTRFWQDREFDFRPLVVRRLVKRLTERSLALRRDDVIQLDTYALPELMKGLGRVDNSSDIERVRRLTHLMAHVTDKDWRLGPDATRAHAASLVRTWQSWWLAEGAHYTTLDGIAKATAVVTQTRYGRWVRSIPLGLGAQPGGSTVLATLRDTWAGTALLLLCGAFGGYLAGAALAVRTLLTGKARWMRALNLLAFAALGVPLATTLLGPGLDGSAPGLARGTACSLMLAFGAGVSYLYQRASTLAKALSLWWPRGQGRAGSTTLVLRASAGALLGLLSTALPMLLVAATVFERAFALRGLGQYTVEAVRHGNVAWLMAMALFGTVVAAMFQLLSDELATALGYQRLRHARTDAIMRIR